MKITGLIDGHTVVTTLKEVNGVIKISDAKIYAENKDVTKNYKITLEDGVVVRAKPDNTGNSGQQDKPYIPEEADNSEEQDQPEKTDVPKKPKDELPIKQAEEINQNSEMKNNNSSAQDKNNLAKQDILKITKEIIVETQNNEKDIFQEGLENEVEMHTDADGNVNINLGQKEIVISSVLLNETIKKNGLKNPRLIVEPFLKIDEIKSNKNLIDGNSETVSEMTFDIVSMVNIRLSEDEKSILLSKEKMEIDNETVTIHLTLPDYFVIPENHMVKILHKKDNGDSYIYDAIINGKNISFDNPNGFSSFTVYTEEIVENESLTIEAETNNLTQNTKEQEGVANHTQKIVYYICSVCILGLIVLMLIILYKLRK